jgi:LacI family transcriptional regulator
MKVTIRDVAREAGVSVATVSRVLNNSGPVHELTRDRVRQIARLLRYSPSPAARTLITSTTQTIGVLLPNLYGEFFSEVIRGIDQAAQRSGFHLLVSSSHADRSELETALRAMRGRVDGLIVMIPDIDAEALLENLPARLPIVLVSAVLESHPFPSLTIDNYEGAYRLTRHLIERGHSAVAMIKGSERNQEAGERLRGYRAALRDAELPHDPKLEIAGDFTEAAGDRAVAEILALEPRPSAIFAANDAMAIGALSVLREAGVRVPEEMAVAGFDDIPIARYISPPLTTVRVGISALGERATQKLLRGISEAGSGQTPTSEVLRPELVIRRSCGARRV